MKKQTELKQQVHQMLSGVLDDHREAERVVCKHGDGLSVLAREKLYQDLAVIKRDVLEIREQLIRSIDENFAIIDRAEQSKHLATAESLASVAMDQFIASLADARNKVQALYVRLKEVVDTAFDSKEKFLRGPH